MRKEEELPEDAATTPDGVDPDLSADEDSTDTLDPDPTPTHDDATPGSGHAGENGEPLKRG